MTIERITTLLNRLGDAAYLPLNAPEAKTVNEAVLALHQGLAAAEAVINLEVKRWGL